jgi:hypothetical protein
LSRLRLPGVERPTEAILEALSLLSVALGAEIDQILIDSSCLDHGWRGIFLRGVGVGVS